MLKIYINILFGLIILMVSRFAVAQAKTYSSENQKYTYKILTEQKDVIWGFDFIDDKTILFTERSGKLKILNLENQKVTEVVGTPIVWSRGQGGLLDVRVLKENKETLVFLSYAEPTQNQKEATTAVGFGVLKENKLAHFKKIFSANAPSSETIHFGSRIEFDGKGNLFLTIGDRNDRDKVQDLAYHNGKVIRIKIDGSIPLDNPFIKTKNAKGEIWSLGHRSPQGLVRDSAKDTLWLAEMGPRGGDEVNLIQPGRNYGWSEVTYGKEYWGPSIGEKSKSGIEQPAAYWVPSISPSAITLYRGKSFPHWEGDLFLACLSGNQIRRLKMKGTEVSHQEVLFKDLGFRFRNIRSGNDGYLYFSTDGGHIARIEPVK